MGKKLTGLLRSFWFQVAALWFVAALAVALRISLLPSHGRYQISPFFAFIEPYIGVYTLLPLAAFAAFFLTRKALSTSRPYVRWAYLIPAFLVFTVTVNAALGGFDKILPGALWQYCFDARILYNYGNFLRDYHVWVEGMHWHANVHPPGVFLYLYPLIKIFPENWIYIAMINALLAGTGAIFVYKAAERLYGIGETKIGAALLYVATPSLLLYGSTVDAVLCAGGAFVVYLIALVITSPRFDVAAALGLVIAIGTFVAYQFGLLWLLIFVAAAACTFCARRSIKKAGGDTPPLTVTDAGPRPPARCRSFSRIWILVAVAAVAFCLFFAVIYFLTGFDVISEFGYQQRASEKYYGAGANVIYLIKHYLLGGPAYQGEHRSALFWIPGNFIAFLFMLGPPTTVLFARNLYDDLKGKILQSAGAVLSCAAAASYVLINLSGLTLAETERVYLFMAPWFVVGSGHYLMTKKPRLLYPALAVNLAAALLFVVFFRHIK
jgi:hypothetical protein